MQVVKLTSNNLKEVVALSKKILASGGLAVIPSDTVYGLAVNVLSSAAVKKIYDFKGRRFGKGVSVFVKDVGDIVKYAVVNDRQHDLIKTLLPGPFTVILKSKGKTAPELEPENRTIGVRLISKPAYVRELNKMISFPITATSANLSGKGPHYTVDALLGTLSARKKAMIDLVVDAGKLPRAPTSTVVNLVEDQVKVLRKGVFDLRFLSKYRSSNPEDTKNVAHKFWEINIKRQLKDGGAMVILKGDLGAGKTVFAQGIGEVFGEHFRSPTFVLMDEYLVGQPPVKNIYHLDLYRIESEEEVLNLKLEKFLTAGNLLLVEWGDKLGSFQELKNKSQGAFFWVQIEEVNDGIREIKVYRI